MTAATAQTRIWKQFAKGSRANQININATESDASTPFLNAMANLTVLTELTRALSNALLVRLNLALLKLSSNAKY